MSGHVGLRPKPEEEELRLKEQELQVLENPARVAAGAFPEDGKTKADLLRAIDEAMYLLRKSSADGVVVANVGILPSL